MNQITLLKSYDLIFHPTYFLLSINHLVIESLKLEMVNESPKAYAK